MYFTFKYSRGPFFTLRHEVGVCVCLIFMAGVCFSHTDTHTVKKKSNQIKKFLSQAVPKFSHIFFYLPLQRRPYFYLTQIACRHTRPFLFMWSARLTSVRLSQSRPIHYTCAYAKTICCPHGWQNSELTSKLIVPVHRKTFSA